VIYLYVATDLRAVEYDSGEHPAAVLPPSLWYAGFSASCSGARTGRRVLVRLLTPGLYYLIRRQLFALEASGAIEPGSARAAEVARRLALLDEHAGERGWCTVGREEAERQADEEAGREVAGPMLSLEELVGLDRTIAWIAEREKGGEAQGEKVKTRVGLVRDHLAQRELPFEGSKGAP
jgi:hypothetical protein